MKRKVVITAGDILTPLGNLEETWAGLLVGKSGIVRQGFGSLDGEWPLGVIAGLPVADGGWNRLSLLFDRLFATLPPLPPETRLFCATTKAAVDEFLHQDGEKNGQPWQVAELLARRFGLVEGDTTVSGACASGSLAIIQGAMRIAAGECEHALIIGFDLLAEFILAGFDSLKVLAPQAAKPFDLKRNGLSLADGAAWLLLEAEGAAKTRGATIMAGLEGWAISCDATHITAPCRRASGLIAAFDKILTDTSVPVGGINAHGTGTVYNDAMELLAFSKKCEPGIPVCSVKGAVGHSLAAAGVTEALLSCLSLEHHILPPTVGLEVPAKSSCVLSGEGPLSLIHPSVISSNSGFGGINAALFLVR